MNRPKCPHCGYKTWFTCCPRCGRWEQEITVEEEIALADELDEAFGTSEYIDRMNEVEFERKHERETYII